MLRRFRVVFWSVVIKKKKKKNEQYAEKVNKMVNRDLSKAFK